MYSLKGEPWVHQTTLTPQLVIEVPVSSAENARSCEYV